MSRTKKLALCAMLSAIGVLILAASGLAFPVRLSLAALAGLIPAIAVLHCGLFWSLGTYAVTAALSLLLLPEKTGAVWYLLFFGHYPVAKSLIERIPNLAAQWIAKLCFFAGCMALLFFLFRELFFAALPDQTLWILLAALCAAFILYDIAFTALVSFYRRRIGSRIDPPGR